MTKKKLSTFKSANAMKSEWETKWSKSLKSEDRCNGSFLKECVEIYEFGAVSRSLFASGGFRLLASDKASILHYLEKLDSNTQQVQADRNETTGSESSDNQTIQVPLQAADKAVEHTNVAPIIASTPSDHY